MRIYNSPSDTLTGLRLQLENATLLDFWQWAFRDLCDDDVKGIFAEWVIAKLINRVQERRISWADRDLISDGGVRIEVKATAYWQSFKLLDEVGRPRESVGEIRPESKVIFAGLKAGNATGDRQDMKVDFKSDLYVFAFQNEKNHHLWNAMDLAQWEFYLRRAMSCLLARSH